jgi:hypothetical protein
MREGKMAKIGYGAFLALLSVISLSCSPRGTEHWPAVEDAVATMLVEFEGAKDAQGRSPAFSGIWETGQPHGDSIPTQLLNLLTEEVGIPLYSDGLGLERERTGILTIFEPRELAPDTIGILATWVFPEADGGWHGLEYEFRYRCSRFGCKRHRYSLAGILN